MENHTGTTLVLQRCQSEQHTGVENHTGTTLVLQQCQSEQHTGVVNHTGTTLVLQQCESEQHTGVENHTGTTLVLQRCQSEQCIGVENHTGTTLVLQKCQSEQRTGVENHTGTTLVLQKCQSEQRTGVENHTGTTLVLHCHTDTGVFFFLLLLPTKRWAIHSTEVELLRSLRPTTKISEAQTCMHVCGMCTFCQYLGRQPSVPVCCCHAGISYFKNSVPRFTGTRHTEQLCFKSAQFSVISIVSPMNKGIIVFEI